MPVNKIIHQLASIENSVMPGAQIYEQLPELVGTLPAVLHFLAPGSLPFPNRDTTYNVTHNIDINILFSLADRPISSEQERSWIDPLRVAIEKDSKLSQTAFNSGITGYHEGGITYAGTQYLALIISVQAYEKVVAGEVAGS